MKITLVGHTIPQSNIPGTSVGISNYIYNLGKRLHEMKHDVQLLIRNDIKPKENWITPIFSPKIGWIPYPFFVYNKIRNIESDIFHADYVNTGAPIIWAKKKPSVVTTHDAIPFTYDKQKLSYMNRLRVSWYKRNFKTIINANAIIVPSENARDETLKYTNLSEEKLHVIPYGIDTDKFRPMKKQELNKIKIGYLGGLDGRKNVVLLVECFRQLSKKYENIELHIGGGGENYEKFKNMNLPRMFLHGNVKTEDTPKFLNSLDIFVFPTVGEGFGLPILEAMACGIPVVATNLTTMPEIVGDSGLLSNPNVDDMMEVISKMIEDRALRKKLAKKALERSGMFTWETAAEKTIKVYKSVID